MLKPSLSMEELSADTTMEQHREKTFVQLIVILTLCDDT